VPESARKQLANDSVVWLQVMVDDGSTDGTLTWLQELANFPHVRVLCQTIKDQLPRNLGVECSVGDTIIFIDSDLVVTPNFLQAHAQSLSARLLDSRERRVSFYLWSTATSTIPHLDLQADGFFSGLFHHRMLRSLATGSKSWAI